MKKSYRVPLLLFLFLFCASFVWGTLAAAEAAEGSAAQAKQAGEDSMTWDTYSNTWGVTDGLGREMPSASETGAARTDKYVLMFYHNWHYEFTRSAVSFDGKAPRNVTRILSEYPDALENAKRWGPAETYHYWGEPIFGYYSLRTDDYVVRKHAQMLTDAGVDAIVLDYTNYMADSEQIPYEADLRNILKVYLEILEEGGDVPQIVIMATWDYTQACKTVQYFYDQFYTDPLYERLWFRWEGKPLFLAWDYMVSPELKAYFTLRRPYPFDNADFQENEWPWNSAYPQKAAYTAENPCEMVTVGVANTINTYTDYKEKISGGMSARDQDGNFIASGRSSTSSSKYLTADPVSGEYHSEAGAAFQESFDHAISLNPSILMVTGWNEWIAARFTKAPAWSDVETVPPYGIFFDQFCAEFSRDIEPTRDGGLQDHFYNQLAMNIRRFKGTGRIVPPSGPTKVTIDGNFDEWDAVMPEYRDDLGDTAQRSSEGIGRKTQYVNETGRNDFKTMKVAYDAEYIYFYAETADAISPYTDPAWMYLLLRVSDTQPNWEGYQYIVNRRGVTESTTVLERSTGGYAWETVNEAIAYAVSGCKMELAIPRAALGIGPEDEIAIDFKWHDHMQTEGDFFEFYLNGDSAPNSRFHYRFTTKAESMPHNGKTSGSRFPLLPVLIAGGALAAFAAAGAGVGLRRRGRRKQRQAEAGTE